MKSRKRKYYTQAEANATLPLLRSILRDITSLAGAWQETQARLQHAQEGLGEAHREEVVHRYNEELDRVKRQMDDYARELQALNIELKDIHTGLVDFPSLRDGREVYLCWKLGEPEVAHWHELEAGFAGRQSLAEKAAAKAF